MKNITEKFDDLDDNIDIDDYPIGLPNGTPVPPMEYDLKKINMYLKENKKSVHELTQEEIDMFKYDTPRPV